MDGGQMNRGTSGWVEVSIYIPIQLLLTGIKIIQGRNNVPWLYTLKSDHILCAFSHVYTVLPVPDHKCTESHHSCLPCHFSTHSVHCQDCQMESQRCDNFSVVVLFLCSFTRPWCMEVSHKCQNLGITDVLSRFNRSFFNSNSNRLL